MPFRFPAVAMSAIRPVVSARVACLVAGTALVIAGSSRAQQGKLTDVSIQGYIYEPARLASTLDMSWRKAC
jgi:hypothetical protein